MQISFNWLKDIIDFDYDVETLADKLTMIGTACEAVEPLAVSLDNVVVGEITKVEKHPNAEKLTVCKVDIGSAGNLTIVCGAPNAAEGMKSAVALPGAVLAGDLKVGKRKMLGVESEAVLCAEDELGISDDHSGIIELDSEMSPGASLKDVLGLDDYVITFELTPNRHDCLSALGIAREIKVLTGNEIRMPAITITEVDENASDEVKVSIADPDACPRYACRVIRDVKIGPSPWWLRQRLLACGIRSINNIVDITNFVMLEYGQPLHAFDYDNFSRREVLVRRAEEGEVFTTLDDVERKLTQEHLLITDGEKPVAIGGIMGGQFSEVSEKTTEILLESANFDPRIIRRGRKLLVLQSESQRRFEGGADPNIVPLALDRAAALIAELAGGKTLSGIVDCYPEKIKPMTLTLRPKRANQILATNISTDEMADILRLLGFAVEGDDDLTVNVPTFRTDVTREIDLIEEIARAYGYDKIGCDMRAGGKLVTNRHQSEQFSDKVRSLLTAQGYYEVVTNSIVDPKQITKLYPDISAVEILNPISEDLKWMRPSLLSCLLNVVKHNLNRMAESVKIFEIGYIFAPADGDLACETQKLALALSGKDRGENWVFHPGKFSFFDLKGGLQHLEALANGSITYSSYSDAIFADDCSLKVLLDGEEVGSCGVISKKVLDLFDIKAEVLYAEVDFSALYSRRRGINYYRQLARYPSSGRDMAVVVDEAVQVSDLLGTINSGNDTILKDVVVFDLFRGKQIESGSKSVAFRLYFQDESKTLTDSEIDKVFDRIVGELEKKYSARLRS